MNTLTHKLAAALLLLCGLLGDATASSAVASASAGDMASSVVSNASGSVSNSANSSASSKPNSSAGSSIIAASASSPLASATASAASPTIGNPGSHAGISPASSTPTGGVGNVLQVISALILVVIIMLGLAWGLKNFGPKRLLGRVPVQVVGGANLGGRERVLVIEVADQWIVIGATPSSITTLATLPRQALNDDELQPGKPFSDWLKQIMEKRNG